MVLVLQSVLVFLLNHMPLEYTTQGNGWVGVTTYMDCQGNLRVKSEILVAGVGIETGSNGLLYPTDLGNA
ncbi:MAG: hypothetical protein CM15mV12_1530 [uncultured marine virus]|nr:MAG: hypothetical protein CM15mV12_1530 [uncultured marine virus]